MTDPIKAFLLDSGIDDDPSLRSFLAQLEQEASSAAPMPSAAVSALMQPARQQSFVRRHRTAVTAIIVVGALGAGATAAAASPDVRTVAQQVIETVTNALPLGAPQDSNDQDTGSVDQTPGSTRPGKPTENGVPVRPTTPDHPGPDDHPGNGAGNDPTPGPQNTSDSTPGNGHSRGTQPGPTNSKKP